MRWEVTLVAGRKVSAPPFLACEGHEEVVDSSVRFFDKFGKTMISRNHLPHWQQVGATFFVTWRLKDSMPAELLKEVFLERDAWAVEHPKPWAPEEEAEYHRLFTAEVERMMDKGYGKCVLRQADCRKALEDALRKMDGDWFTLHAWVAMPNHAHLLFTLEDDRRLEKVVASWKRYSALEINRLTGESGGLWQKDYFDRIIRGWDHLFRVARYIRRNPTKANLSPDEFTLWEADWLKKMLD